MLSQGDVDQDGAKGCVCVHHRRDHLNLILLRDDPEVAAKAGYLAQQCRGGCVGRAIREDLPVRVCYNHAFDHPLSAHLAHELMEGKGVAAPQGIAAGARKKTRGGTSLEEGVFLPLLARPVDHRPEHQAERDREKEGREERDRPTHGHSGVHANLRASALFHSLLSEAMAGGG